MAWRGLPARNKKSRSPRRPRLASWPLALYRALHPYPRPASPRSTHPLEVCCRRTGHPTLLVVILAQGFDPAGRGHLARHNSPNIVRAGHHALLCRLDACRLARPIGCRCPLERTRQHVPVMDLRKMHSTAVLSLLLCLQPARCARSSAPRSHYAPPVSCAEFSLQRHNHRLRITALPAAAKHQRCSTLVALLVLAKRPIYMCSYLI